jgi:hypothetical protein
MKKKMLVFVLLALTACVLYATMVTQVYRKQVTIHAPIKRLIKQIAIIDNYKNWYSAFAGASAGTITISGKDKISNGISALKIITLNEKSCLLQVEKNNRSKEVFYDISADTVYRNTVTLIYKSTLWKHICGSDDIVRDAESSLLQLKAFTEDTKRTYGFSTMLVEVTDTTFLFASKIVANADKKQSIIALYEQLINYANTKDAGYTGVRIFNAAQVGKDSVRLQQGIAVSKNTTTIPFYGPISLKQMPYKRMLVKAEYEGKFGNIQKVFDAMDQFISDENLITMAIPFIKFNDAAQNFEDSAFIKVSAYFPVK